MLCRGGGSLYTSGPRSTRRTSSPRRSPTSVQMDTRIRGCRHSPWRGYPCAAGPEAGGVTPVSPLGSKLVCTDPDQWFYRPRSLSQEECQREKGNIYLLTENRIPVASFFYGDTPPRPGTRHPGQWADWRPGPPCHCPWSRPSGWRRRCSPCCGACQDPGGGGRSGGREGARGAAAPPSLRRGGGCPQCPQSPQCPPQGRGRGTTRAWVRLAVKKYSCQLVSFRVNICKTTRQRFLGSFYMMKYGLKREIESSERVQREQLENLS